MRPIRFHDEDTGRTPERSWIRPPTHPPDSDPDTLCTTKPERLRSGAAPSLAHLLECEDADEPCWRKEELRSVLAHQLSAPLEFDLETLDPGRQRLIVAAGEIGGAHGGITSFEDLFRHPQPPVALLNLAKKYTKTHRLHPDSLIPPEISTALYYACIVAARVRCRRRITALPDASLRRGLECALRQDWLTPSLRHLFLLGLNSLTDRPEDAPTAANAGWR